jgi:hypothetical protein
MMEKLRYRSRRLWLFLRYRKNQIVLLFLLCGFAFTILWLATDGFTAKRDEVLLNFGTDILGLIFAYLLFDSILQRIEQDRIKENPEFDIPRFIKMIEQAERKIRILNTWTDLISVSAYREKFLPAVKRATMRGVRFEFLILDPRSTAVAERQRDIGPDYNVEQSIRDNLQEIYKLVANSTGLITGNVHVRLYDRIPTIAFNMVDERAFVSFYPLNKSSSQNNQLEVSMRTQLGGFLDDTFNEMWLSAEERDLDKYHFMSLLNTEENTGQEPYKCRFVRLQGLFYIISGQVAADLIGRSSYPDFQVHLSGSYVPCKIELIKKIENREKFDAASRLFIRKYGNFDDNTIFQITPEYPSRE